MLNKTLRLASKTNEERCEEEDVCFHDLEFRNAFSRIVPNRNYSF